MGLALAPARAPPCHGTLLLLGTLLPLGALFPSTLGTLLPLVAGLWIERASQPASVAPNPQRWRPQGPLSHGSTRGGVTSAPWGVDNQLRGTPRPDCDEGSEEADSANEPAPNLRVIPRGFYLRVTRVECLRMTPRAELANDAVAHR